MTSIYDDIDQKKAKELYEKLPFIIIICNEARKICFCNAMARHNVYSLKKGTNLNRFFDFDIDPDKAIHVSIENADYVLFSTRITFEGENAWLLTFSAYSNVLDKSFLESYAKEEYGNVLVSIGYTINMLNDKLTGAKLGRYLSMLKKNYKRLTSIYGMMGALNDKMEATLDSRPGYFSTVQICENFTAKMADRVATYGRKITYENLAPGALAIKTVYKEYFRVLTAALAFCFSISGSGEIKLVSAKENNRSVVTFFVTDKYDVLNVYKNWVLTRTRTRSVDDERDNAPIIGLTLLNTYSSRMGAYVEYQRLNFDKKLAIRISTELCDGIHEATLRCRTNTDDYYLETFLDFNPPKDYENV